MRYGFFAILLWASFAHSELPSPRLDRIFPLGAAAGTTVEIEIAGADLEEPKLLRFDHPGITAEFQKDRKFKVTVAANVPGGTYDARVLGKWGLSSPRLFIVSHRVAEQLEKEPNDEQASAQLVEMNSAIHATSDGNKDDLFKFVARKGQRITIDCQAGTLDSMMDATMTLTTGDGKLLASSGDYNGRDPFLDFIAPTDGEYSVNVHDLSYRGGFVYRLLVTDRPTVDHVFPRAIQTGRSSPITLYGRNLAGGAKPSTWKWNDLSFDEKVESITPPSDILARGTFQFSDHPTTHTVLPTAATATLAGFQVHGVPVMVTNDPVTLEAEPNDDSKRAQTLVLPVVLSGRFDRDRDADWFEFETIDGGNHSFEVYCERIAGRADPYLVLFDAKGNRVNELDDFGPRVNAFDGHIRDVSGSISLNAKTKYRVLVQDRYRRGGARYQYVLSIRKSTPDFHISAIHGQNPGPGGTTVRRGGATHLDLILHNSGGFNGPLTITAEGLPKGLRASPMTILSDTRGTFVLWADADAPEFAGPIKLIATGKAGEANIVREVRSYTRVWSNPDMNSSRPTRELFVAIAENAPYSVRPLGEKLDVVAGQKVELKLQIARNWPEFKGPITIVPLAFPGPIKMNQITIGEGKTEATITLEVQAGARPGDYTLAVQGQAQVSFTKDAKSAKTNTLVSQPSQPFTLVVKAAKK